ncbi:MAG: hypothetical protein A2214_01240 [Candidatus Harrisonbacteria bacterium RIFOXYA1_FULL_48_8]|nr:MAG: hypothetical protein A2214_01240 [Candidatus Harrisonbacteria bacterium RIFOXYA1_FULL_48_8]
MTRHTTPDVLGMVLSPQAKTQVLQMLDFLWMSHLENVEALADSVRLRAYGQHDPLVEYRREGHLLYQQLLADFEKWVEENKSKLEQISNDKLLISNQTPSVNDKNIRNSTLGISNSSQKTGRNDPCPCGSGKKYKKCHGA